MVHAQHCTYHPEGVGNADHPSRTMRTIRLYRDAKERTAKVHLTTTLKQWEQWLEPKSQLIKNDRRFKCNTTNCVTFVVPDLSTSSPSSSSTASSTVMADFGQTDFGKTDFGLFFFFFFSFFCVTKFERRSVHKQVRHDLQNARKTNAPWITDPTGSGRPQPRETKESAHQSHPTPATPAVRKQTSRAAAHPSPHQLGLASGLGSCQETNKSQSLRRQAPASLHKPTRTAPSCVDALRWGVPSACKGHTTPRAVCCPSSSERSRQGPSQTN